MKTQKERIEFLKMTYYFIFKNITLNIIVIYIFWKFKKNILERMGEKTQV
jgi:hypothetical protein